MLSIMTVMCGNWCRATTIAFLLVYAGTADAYGTLRCKGRLVNVGDSTAKVLSLCGEPARRVVRQVPVRAGVQNGFTRLYGLTTTERWIYDRGWGKFPAVFFIDDGVIRRVDYLPGRSHN